jgi:predicted metal-dependent enzyme (double-stranded beta helix superfamily)
VINRVPRRQLIDFTRFYADEVASGRYPYVRFDEDERWHQRIYRDPRIDIWVISWLPTQCTELHDHGGSSGAFTVLTGALTEAVPSPAGIRDTVRAAGTSVGFGPHYIHDVRNLAAEPAVSVHAYSPPLTTMNFYDVDDHRIVRVRSLVTDDPEPALQSAS